MQLGTAVLRMPKEIGLDIVRRKEKMKLVKPRFYTQGLWWSDTEETRTSQVKNTVGLNTKPICGPCLSFMQLSTSKYYSQSPMRVPTTLTPQSQSFLVLRASQASSGSSLHILDHTLFLSGRGTGLSALRSSWGSRRKRRAGILQLHIMQVHRRGGGVFAHTLVWVGLVRVVPAHMLDHLELLLGLVAAEAAEEGVAVGVGEGMMAQASSPAESTMAHIAHIGLGLTVLA